MMSTRTVRMLRREKMEITVPTLIDLFLTTKQTEGRSPRTITWYRDLLTRFAEFVGNGNEARLTDLTIHDARSFIAALRERTTRYDDHPLKPVQEGGLASSTIQAHVRALKAFSNWLHEEGFTNKPVFARLKRPCA